MKFDIYKKKTYTNHWNNFFSEPKKNNFLIKVLKKLKFFLYNFIGYKIKVSIVTKNSNEDISYNSYLLNRKLIDLRNKKLSKVLIEYLSKFNFQISETEIKKFISEFEEVYYRSPIRDLGSGFGYNESLFLFCILKIIQPTDVIESGLMKGFTSYIIDKATNKNCKMHCYDISFENLIYKSKKGNYHNCDISDSPPKFIGKKVFAFWDDHVSQLDRLNYSIENKVKFNMFDDDLSFLNLHSDGWPPIPTINMLFEIKEKFYDESNISWMSRNRSGEIILENLKNFDILKKIKHHSIFTDVFQITGYKNHSQCSFLVLK